MSVKLQACKECRFYDADDSECRRHAPRMVSPEHKWLEYHNSELLRDIAWTLRQMGNIAKPEEDDDVYFEATEVSKATWPFVEETDWCGEFEPMRG